MEFRKFMGLGMQFEEGVDLSKYLTSIHIAKEEQVLKLKKTFEEHGYNINKIPGEFVKIFTSNEKELVEIDNVIKEVERLGLKEIFNANLKPATFTLTMLERVKYCLNNNIPFVNSDNTFTDAMWNKESFGEHTAKTPLNEVSTKSLEEAPNFNEVNIPTVLDEEDLSVKNEIIKTLTEINRNNPGDGTLTFIISSMITNLDSVIANDKKNYRIMGTKHLVEDALQGMMLTPEIEDIINQKVLVAFNNVEGKNRGVA